MTLKSYGHYSKWPQSQWPWRNFSPREMASKREGELALDTDAMDKLQALRDRLGVPLLITSAYRSEAHNRAVGGAKNSYHVRGRAFDVRMENQNPREFEAAARAVGFTGFGHYVRQGFMHIDTRLGDQVFKGSVNDWPESATGTPPEPRPASKAPAVGAGASGAVALALDVAPAASGVLGQLTDVAQIVAVVAVVGFAAWMIWKGRE